MFCMTFRFLNSFSRITYLLFSLFGMLISQVTSSYRKNIISRF
nr:MAG TPA: hypothetical protein [Bacteriophage sp.]